MEPPAEFICPITQEVMEDPVIAPDGVTYDREPLLAWFGVQRGKNLPTTLPSSNIPCTPEQLTPNRALRSQIENFRQPQQPVIVTGRQALHVCVVMDISGSMGVAATKRTTSGEKETMANSILDLVKYATKSVAHMLGPGDLFSLVAFSTNSEVIVEAAGPERIAHVDTRIASIHEGGCTNLGEGFRAGLQLLCNHHSPARVNVVMALTDGQPNEGTEADSVVGSFFRTQPDVMARTVVNTYAFGFNDIASDLMLRIANMGHGTFGYIPDISFLGTVFVHTMANMCAITDIQPEPMGVVVGDGRNPQLSAGLQELVQNGPFSTSSEALAVAAAFPGVDGLAFDIEDQVAPALRPEYYHRWGRHYVRSLASAHFRGVCDNFKSKSVVSYQTLRATKLHDAFNDIFNTLAPPKPTAASGTIIQTAAQFNNSNDPCVHEDTLVTLLDGTTIEAKHVRPGDQVKVPGGSALTVSQVIKTRCAGGENHFVVFPSGLRVTPWHPVYYNGQWVLPCDLGFPRELLPCKHVYSFACNLGKFARIPAMYGDQVPFVVLGHEYPSDSLLYHPFFGSVAACIDTLPADANVHEFGPQPILKDPATNLACAWDMAKYVGGYRV